MIKDKIFVIVPVYNVEQYLERCVNSLLNQTYSNYEIVLVDDGSTDRSPTISDRFSKEYEKVITIHKSNGGQSEARNVGLDYVRNHCDADSTWITFIDSDDYVHPQYLQLLYESALSAGVNICCCSYIRTAEIEPQIPNEKLSLNYEVMTPEEFWCKDRTNALMICTKLYRFSCLAEAVYPVGSIHEDEFITHTILFPENKIAKLDYQLYFYFNNINSTMTKEWSPKRLVGLDAFEKQMLFFQMNGFGKAYQSSLAALCEHSIKHVKYIKMLSPKYDYLLKDVKKRRNSALKEYGKRYGKKEEFRIWYQYSIRNPIKKALNNESVFSFIKRQIKRRLLHK